MPDSTTRSPEQRPAPLATCIYCGHGTINTHDSVCAVCVEVLKEAALLPDAEVDPNG